MSTKGVFQKSLLDAIISCDSELVFRILHENEYSDVLDVCLLHFIHEVIKRSSLENDSSSTKKVALPLLKKFDIIYMLLDAGADIDTADENGNTCLYYAAQKENLELCDILLQCGADMWASTEHSVSICDYISQMHTSKDLISIFNKFHPGLWKAVECENIYQVRQLINYWCRTNLHKNGLSLKDIALETGNEEIISLIFGVWESMELIYHIYAKNIPAVKKMLETCRKKLRLNLRKMSDFGAPILYYLIQSRDVPAIELFINYDCQIYTIMQDHLGNDMPVLFSALKSDIPLSVVEALLPGNKVQLEEILYKILYKGKTILEIAMENGVNAEIFQLLIDRGGPLLLCDRNQFSETVRDIAVTHQQLVYINVIDQCVFNWIMSPTNYCGRREKLAVLGWKFEFDQYMENGKTDDRALDFVTHLNLIQDHIKDLSLAIELGNIPKFIELKTTTFDCNLYQNNLLWHARAVGNGMPLLHMAVLYNSPEIVEIILNEKPLKESIDNLFDQNHRTALHYAFASSSTKRVQQLLLHCGCSEHVLDKMNKEPLDFKEKQDTHIMIELINRLKSKNFSEVEPDPWNSNYVELDATVPNIYCSQEYSHSIEEMHDDLCYNHDCDSGNLDYITESRENENCDNLDETESEDEEEGNHMQCLIS